MAALETVQQEKAAAARAVPTNHGGGTKSNGKPPCNNDTVNNAKQSIIVKNGDENSDPQLQRSQSAKGKIYVFFLNKVLPIIALFFEIIIWLNIKIYH